MWDVGTDGSSWGAGVRGVIACGLRVVGGVNLLCGRIVLCLGLRCGIVVVVLRL